MKKKVWVIGLLVLVCFCLVAVGIEEVLAGNGGGGGNVAKAKSFMKARMFPQAVAILQKEVNNNPANAEAHFQLGICYTLQGDYGGADDRFASAVSINPDRYGHIVAQEYAKAGIFFLGIGQFERADHAFSKALQYNPKLISTIGEEYKNAGTAYLNIGQIEEADRLFSRALQCKPQLGGVIAEGYLKAGKNYLDWQPEIAEKVFSSAIAFSPVLGERICDIYFEKGKAGANKTDFEFLEKARKYCSRHDEEILGILIANLPGETITKTIKPGEIVDISPVLKGQKMIYLDFIKDSFSHRVDRGDGSACWRSVDEPTGWQAQIDGIFQVRGEERETTFIVNISPSPTGQIIPMKKHPQPAVLINK